MVVLRVSEMIPSERCRNSDKTVICMKYAHASRFYVLYLGNICFTHIPHGYYIDNGAIEYM